MPACKFKPRSGSKFRSSFGSGKVRLFAASIIFFGLNGFSASAGGVCELPVEPVPDEPLNGVTKSGNVGLLIMGGAGGITVFVAVTETNWLLVTVVIVHGPKLVA